MQPSHALSDYISFQDPSPSNYPLSSTNSSAVSRPLPLVTPSNPSKSCALELNTSQSSPISLPHVPTPIVEQVPELPLVPTSTIKPLAASDMPIAPAQNSTTNQNSHPMLTRGKAEHYSLETIKATIKQKINPSIKEQYTTIQTLYKYIGVD
ncbi:hypothetical protein Pint_25466 [Pistacia integerrima]|uniref:Uncharacterized protein n=1 Tax=Pistacia integerrima TaxID=434235 RepID=A0ACC0YGQ8_9ROSI|nr:hypothetical protein Pint_25466 [Pistacia integerrima]